MKKGNYIKRRSRQAMLAAITVVAMTAATQSEASVVWTFSQEGNDVVAVASGTFAYRSMPVTDPQWFQQRFDAGETFLWSLDVASGDRVREGFHPQGMTIDFNFLDTPDDGTGQFGHSGAAVFTEQGFINGSEVNATLTWLGQTLDGVLGVDVALPGSPHVLWVELPAYADLHPGGPQTISLVRAVPEPSAPALLMAGMVVGVFARRRRVG
ncbi:hypothetical protein NT6N_30810 [Oceaniferula spumae]|uniref:Ice-binding protein C-terminal domain-containing protein n=1 Tax=Oceaniferula spumae TaxID=2979115 RepID=A0AAT9FQ76_9BACT